MAATSALDDRWLAAERSLALRVPSAMVPGSWDFIVDPRHPYFSRVRWSKAVPLRLDSRLIERHR